MKRLTIATFLFLSLLTTALPLVSRAQMAPAEASPDIPAITHRPQRLSCPAATVLYIEDNASNMLLVKEVLARRSGIELLGAVTGRIGLELARERQPDLILPDLQLPDLPGDIVLPALKADARTRDIPIILVSADATPTQIRRLLGLGAETYLTKPLDLPAFLRAVDGALTAKRAVSMTEAFEAS